MVDHARSDGRRHRAPEILTQVLPQVPFWNSIVPMSPWRNPFSFEFLGIALHFGMQITHRFKHAFAVPRPNELSVHVQPILQTPGWSALPSGHATEAYMAARILRALLGQDDRSPVHAALQRQAQSIADNRVYAGLHYPVDSLAGQILGETLAEYVLSRCTQMPWTPRTFAGADSDLKSIDFKPLEHPMCTKQPWLALGTPAAGASADALLAHLWKKACAEWRAVGFEPTV